LVSVRIDEWRLTWSRTVEAETAATRALLDRLQAGDSSVLRQSSVQQAELNQPEPTEPELTEPELTEPKLNNEKLGMCGWLRTYNVTR
jgi:hypothetical protein